MRVPCGVSQSDVFGSQYPPTPTSLFGVPGLTQLALGSCAPASRAAGPPSPDELAVAAGVGLSGTPVLGLDSLSSGGEELHAYATNAMETVAGMFMTGTKCTAYAARRSHETS